MWRRLGRRVSLQTPGRASSTRRNCWNGSQSFWEVWMLSKCRRQTRMMTREKGILTAVGGTRGWCQQGFERTSHLSTYPDAKPQLCLSLTVSARSYEDPRNGGPNSSMLLTTSSSILYQYCRGRPRTFSCLMDKCIFSYSMMSVSVSVIPNAR